VHAMFPQAHTVPVTSVNETRCCSCENKARS